jgi:glutamate synthase domain-containing protein 3
MKWLAGFFLLVGLPLLLSELTECSPWLAARLIQRAANRLGPPYRARYEEEWLAELNEVPGNLTKLAMAVQVLVRARATSRELKELPEHNRPKTAGDPESSLGLRPEPSFSLKPPVSLGRSSLADQLYEDAYAGLRDGDLVYLTYPIANTDRAVGARLGVAIREVFGSRPPAGRSRIELEGTAGQSFGALLAPGIDLRLVGACQDYVGKGMKGGRIVVRPPEDDAGAPVLIGNTALYGATRGELFCAGRAGERFAVRNSGATAVVEGVGDHGGEYMTGGSVIVLGPVGRNLGAGMTGGELFLYDPDDQALDQLNDELAQTHRPDEIELVFLRELIVAHHELTGSAVAGELLDDWDRSAAAFWRVAPRAEVAAIERPHKGAAIEGAC